MEQVLFRIHVRCMTTACNFIKPPARVVFEKLILFTAVASLFITSVLHFSYVSTNLQHTNCLVSSERTNHYNITGGTINSTVYVDINNYLVDVLNIHITRNLTDRDLNYLNFTAHEASTLKYIHYALGSIHSLFTNNTSNDTCAVNQQLSAIENVGDIVRTYRFSTEKGYLLLPQQVLSSRNIAVSSVYISSSSTCFGHSFSSLLLKLWVGYDTVTKNWVIRSFGGRGYLHNTQSQEIYDLNQAADFVARTGNAGSTGLKQNGISGLQNYVAFKVGVVLTTLFLFFTTTTLVSFTLRVTQERMLKFTFLLQYNISNRIPIGLLIGTHVIETLVFVPLMIGLLFFMIEFFFDQFLAFLVLSLVWFAEVFSVISLRTKTSMQYFPVIFFLYFSLFHIYFFCFPFGYSYLALFTAVLFLTHAMICFWNYCEIPAFEAGLVTAIRPRFGVQEESIPSLHAFVRTNRLSQRRSSTGSQQSYSLFQPSSAVNSPRPPSPGRLRSSSDSASSHISSQDSPHVTGAINLNLSNSDDWPAVSAMSVRRPAYHRPSLRRVTGNPPPSPLTSSSQSRESENIQLSPGTQQREISYSRHVELSRRIQNLQVAAMLGISEPVNVNARSRYSNIYGISNTSLDTSDSADFGLSVESLDHIQELDRSRRSVSSEDCSMQSGGEMPDWRTLSPTIGEEGMMPATEENDDDLPELN